MLRILDGNTLVLDGSGVSDWLRCHQLYGYKHHCNGGGCVPVADPIELTAGRAVHAALDALYRATRGRVVTVDALAAAKAAQAQVWRKSTSTPDWRCEEYVNTLLDAYALQYPSEDFTVREIEAPFARVLGRVRIKSRWWGVLYQGRRDLTVSYIGTDHQEWIMDHKTTTSETDFDAQWGQSLSQRGYVWSRGELVGRVPEGYIMNMLGWRKPTAKASALPRFFFHRVPVLLKPHDLEEWRVSVLGYAREIIQCYCENKWPKSGACAAYGRRCAYRAACDCSREQRERLLSTGSFRRNDWSPLQDGTGNASK